MRCEDVIQELAAPSGDDSTALAEHLARCPRCADWASRGARFERLWEATRPEEPSAASWATVWANVSQALDAAGTEPVAPAARPSRSRPTAVARPWRRGTLALFAIAQAAVLLAAVWLGSRPGAGPAPQVLRPGADLALRTPTPAAPESNGSVPDPAPTARAPMTAADAGPEVVIDPGALVLIESGRGGTTVVSRVIDEGSSAVDANFVMFNMLEAMAE